MKILLLVCLTLFSFSCISNLKLSKPNKVAHITVSKKTTQREGAAFVIYGQIVSCSAVCRANNKEPIADFVYMVTSDQIVCICNDERTFRKFQNLDQTPLIIEEEKE
jgi:hypothetical protein